MTSGVEPDLKAMTGVPQAIASIMTRRRVLANDGKEQRSCARQKLLFRFIINLADKLDPISVDLRVNLFLEIFRFAPRYLGGDTKRHFGSVRDPNGGFRSFLCRQSAQESEIGAGLEGRAKKAGGHAMVNSADPVGLT